MPWRRAGCGKWRVITDLRCPLGSMLSATPSRTPTMGDTDSITDVSHRADSCSARTWIHTNANELSIHVQNCDLSLHDCKTEGAKKAAFWIHFRAFSHEDWRGVQSGSCMCTLTFPLHSSSENLPKSRVWKVKCNQCLCISFGREPPPTNPQNTRTLWWISVSREMKWKRLGSVFSISSHHLFSNQRRKSELCVYVCACEVTVINGSTLSSCIIHPQSPSHTAKSCDCVVWGGTRCSWKFEAKRIKSTLPHLSLLPETASAWKPLTYHVEQPLSSFPKGKVKSQEVYSQLVELK